MHYLPFGARLNKGILMVTQLTLGFQGLYWWGLAGSNRRPPACEAGTLTS